MGVSHPHYIDLFWARKEKIVKVYLFYLDNLPEYADSHKRLYAFTDKKELADEFMKTRDMEKFLLVKDDLSKEEYRFLKDKFRGCIITKTQFRTRSTEAFGESTLVDVVCTWSEEESVLKNSERMWEQESKCLIDSTMLKDEYIQALEKLLYIKFYGFYNPSITNDYFYEPYYTAYGPVENFILEDFKNNYVYDELMLFLKFFKCTFKE